MNGSNCGVAGGRQGAKSPRHRAPADVAEPAGWGLGPMSSKGPCAVCRKVNRPSAFCEGRWLEGDDVRGRGDKDEVQPDRHGLVVCKGCCIGALRGQRCVWWDLCWNI